MDEVALLHNYLVVGALLVAIGLVGFLTRRNIIVMFLSVEIVLQGVSLSLAAWSRYHNDWGGQALVLFIIAIAACEAAVALALVLVLARRRGTLDVAALQHLAEPGVAPHVDRRIPEETEQERQFPRLTPAGRLPEIPEEELLHRSRV